MCSVAERNAAAAAAAADVHYNAACVVEAIRSGLIVTDLARHHDGC